jgi:hypothetical protein
MLGGERPQRLLLQLEFSFHHLRPLKETPSAECTAIEINYTTC